MGKKVAVIQSNYIPWKGYFDMIHDVDQFIFYDDLQYTKNDWRNRNQVKTSNGPKWLTIPVGSHNDQLISEIRLKSKDWSVKHWRTLTGLYSRAPYFSKYKDFFEEIYLRTEWRFLSELNQSVITRISRELLGIKTVFSRSQDFHLSGKRTRRLIDLLKMTGADAYLSGPAAKDYIDEQSFADEDIRLEYKDYSGYPEYGQFFPPFTHQVTVLDMLFHLGPDTPAYIWGWRKDP